MPALLVRAPDLDAPLALDLPRGGVALIGRAPDPAEVADELPEGLGAGVTPVVVPSPRRHVSKNHLLVWRRDDGAVVVKDLRAANGTWLRLPAGAPVILPDASRAALHLGGPAPAPRAATEPAEAEWAERADFPEAVRGVVAAFFDALGVEAEVRTRGGAGGAAEVFPLADGSELSVALPPDRTWSAELVSALGGVRAAVARANARFQVEEGHDEGFVLASRALRAAHLEVAEAARRGSSLVLIGETGAGKDDLARCYHAHGGRGQGPFVVIHCGNLVGDIGYVDLFGAVEGGAQGVRAKKGAVEDAVGGTLFLDELAEMPPKYQAALLRFLNPSRDAQGRRRTGEFFRLGDPNRGRPRYAEDVQVVAATSVGLDDPVVRARQGFRGDLWNRLAQHVVRVPPLSARPEDVRAFLHLFPREQPVKLAEALSPEALRVVLEHRWPGNFRELWNFARSPRLPAVLAPGSVGAALCREVLRLGDAPASAPRRAAEGALAAVLPDVDWEAASAEASRAFAEDNGGPAATIGQLDDYVRLYLKPVLVAHAAGLADAAALPKDVNYSELGRRLHFKDGTSVRLQLARYIERFRR